MTTFRVVGPGRAGRSMMAALDAVGGYESADTLGRADDPARAAHGVDLAIIATPDDEVARVASRITPVGTTVVIHLSGSLGLEVLGDHPRRGSLHPLVPLPTPEVGADRLRSGVTFAVAGDPLTRTLAEHLGGTPVEVDEDRRTLYHAAATIAANHLVALLGQVERVAASAGLPLEAFAGLVRAATEDALTLSPRDALTGPAARGDWDTVERHRSELAALVGHRTELAAYDAMVGLARRLSVDISGPAATGTAAPSGGTGPLAPTAAPAGGRAVAVAPGGNREQVA